MTFSSFRLGLAHQEGRKIGRFEDETPLIIGALIEVHRGLGPGLLESAYEACLCAELSIRGMRFERQRGIPLVYKNHVIDIGFRADLIVEDRVLIELKAIERLLPVHEAQVVTYLRLADIPVGLLVNFNVLTLKYGLRRLTREHPSAFRSSDLPVQSKPDSP